MLLMCILNRTGGIQLRGKTAEKDEFRLSIEEARRLLRNRRQLTGCDEDTFGVVNVDEFHTQMDQMTGAIAAVVDKMSAI